MQFTRYTILIEAQLCRVQTLVDPKFRAESQSLIILKLMVKNKICHKIRSKTY